MAKTEFPVRDYDLAATLTSGQAFRWKLSGGALEGVIHGRWVRLRQAGSPPPEGSGVGSLDVGCSMLNVGCSPTSPFSIIEATTAEPQADWRWLTDYLRLDDDHTAALASFPDDAPMRAATAHCRGLRLLRQEPWECLASFILSSTKQIVQIQQCVALLCQRYGERIVCAEGQHLSRHFHAPQPHLQSGAKDARTPNADATHRRIHDARSVWSAVASAPLLERTCYAFPIPARIAAASEAELRECKMGFRAKYLLDAARRVSSGRLDLAALPTLPLEDARAELMACHGVGRKIADCVLLFSLGFDGAFPIDVWVERALQQLYFPKRRVKRARLERFATTHFGAHAGLAQQYLFHYLRTAKGRERTRK